VNPNPRSSCSGEGDHLAHPYKEYLEASVIAAAGVATAFLLDALSFLGVIFVIFTWKRPVRKTAVPAETLSEASWAAVRYVRYSPGIRTLLVRSSVATADNLLKYNARRL
jgi:hypothetical protein